MPNTIYTYQPIDPIECMGDSLTKINNNNFLADGAIGVLETRIATVSSDLNTRINTTNTTLSTVPYARLNDGNQSGSAPIFGARAWVNFDGSRKSDGTAVKDNTNRFIRGSGNINYVLRTAVGKYTVVFNTPLQDENYALFGSSTLNTNLFMEVSPGTNSMTSLSCQINVGYDYGGGSGTTFYDDPETILVSFIR